MAIFGNIETVRLQVQEKKFEKAFEYLDKVCTLGSMENERLSSLEIGTFEKIIIDENNFALEQIYHSKEREECFFESHKSYIDVQFIVEGEEIIEVENIDKMIISFQYDKKMDLIKYEMCMDASTIVLKKGDIAIFYPKDGHMPCIKTHKSYKVIKTVVKVKV